ncbi:MAG: metal-sensitive transcriptional regulator [Akkermansia sp.]|nr:metal-sensitive transcriptional regulator [Akkermansia sp.]
MNTHPCHRGELTRLNRVSGQLAGVKRMIEDGRYCPEILMQLRAIRAAIRRIESGILQKHMEHCVAQALRDGTETESKIEELMKIFDRYED